MGKLSFLAILALLFSNSSLGQQHQTKHRQGGVQIVAAFAEDELFVLEGTRLCDIAKRRQQTLFLGTKTDLDELAILSCTEDADDARQLDRLVANLPSDLNPGSYRVRLDNAAKSAAASRRHWRRDYHLKSGRYQSKFIYSHQDDHQDEIEEAIAQESVAREAALSLESQARVQGDVLLQGLINQEQTTRGIADQAEAAARAVADTAEQAARQAGLSQEALARLAAVQAEALQRHTMDVNLASDIDANRNDIDLNSVQISNLTNAVDSLETEFNALTGNLNYIETLIEEQGLQIEELASVSHEQLLALQAAVQSDLMVINDELGAMATEFTDLENDLNQQNGELLAQLEATQFDIDDAQSRLVLLESLQLGLLSNKVQSHGDRIQTLETKVEQLAAELLAVDAQFLTLEALIAAGIDVSEQGLCLSFDNTEVEDLPDNDFFDACITMANEGATSVEVRLTDAAGNIVLSESGDIVGQWAQDYVTSTQAPQNQFVQGLHNQRITLGNGDSLLISGKTSSQGGCSGSLANGYAIAIYSAQNLSRSGIKLFVAPYRLLAPPHIGVRGLPDWTPANEISWAEGQEIDSCARNPGQFTPFLGRLEVFVR